MHENRGAKEENIEEVKKSEANREWLHRLSERQRRKRLSAAIGRQRLVAQAEIDRLSSLLTIPEKTRESSLEIYRKAWENDLIHGRSIEKILAASMYMACRKHNVPRTLDEIEKVTRVGRKDIIKACKLLANRLGMKLAPISPLEYVGRFCAKLNLTNCAVEKAREIVERALARDMTSGRGPTGIAASAIYIAAILCDTKKTQKEVAEATGVTEVTLRVRYKEMAAKLGIKVE
ncbi:transcription initiation factor IIB [ANME-1 cluster archaeon AG-394-G06]|nr:transcription initiation factor IIB [ANME-1 cluster archaeon AG-394-G06]